MFRHKLSLIKSAIASPRIESKTKRERRDYLNKHIEDRIEI